MTASTSFSHRPRWLRQLLGRPRLMLCALLGLASLVVMPDQWRLTTRLLIAWNAGIVLYLGLAMWMMAHASEVSIRRRAALIDESRFVVLIFSVIAAVASIVAIIMQLAAVKDMHGLLKALHLGLAGLTILSAWTFIHAIFAQHYAHEYFVERASEMHLPPEQRGGLEFPGAGSPNYTDFLYFAFVIGVAAQTADVAICSRPMRRVALVHCVLSFLFNTTILALTINIAAGLI
jgi:uncharacterized membrane protein